MVEVTVEAMSNAIQRTLSKQLNYSHTFTYGGCTNGRDWKNFI